MCKDDPVYPLVFARKEFGAELAYRCGGGEVGMLCIYVLVLRRSPHSGYEERRIGMFKRVRRYGNDVCTSRGQVGNKSEPERGERSLLDFDYQRVSLEPTVTHGYDDSPCMKFSVSVRCSSLGESICDHERANANGRLPVVACRQRMRSQCVRRLKYHAVLFTLITVRSKTSYANLIRYLRRVNVLRKRV